MTTHRALLELHRTLRGQVLTSAFCAPHVGPLLGIVFLLCVLLGSR